jgi:hypothetical protein
MHPISQIIHDAINIIRVAFYNLDETDKARAIRFLEVFLDSLKKD